MRLTQLLYGVDIMSARIELYFSQMSPLGMERVKFSYPSLHEDRLAVRGKAASAWGSILSFQWSLAVQALALLLVRTALSPRGEPPVLCGGAGSIAASLDYAIGKQPAWLLDMFGVDAQGIALIRRVIRRTNPERKRGGDVAISIRPSVLSGESISVFVGNKRVKDSVELTHLAKEIEKQWCDGRKSTSLGRIESSRWATKSNPVSVSPINEALSRRTSDDSAPTLFTVQLIDSRTGTPRWTGAFPLSGGLPFEQLQAFKELVQSEAERIVLSHRHQSAVHGERA